MRNRKYSISFLVASFLLMGVPGTAQPLLSGLSDKDGTPETKALFSNLKKLTEKGWLFGHQDDLAYGVNWRYEKERSDVKEACGDYPALYGWDLGGLERENNDKNIDGVPFKKMRQYIKEGYKRGGVITVSWHMDNPLTGGGSWDTTQGTVVSVLPGGINHKLYKKWLDKAADFFLSLKGDSNELIPVLFRPLHELTGTWFWWGSNNCTPDDFKVLWRFTNYYLKTVKNCHNLIYVYNTGGDFKTKDEYLMRYPGDEVVDVLSYDTYQYDDPKKNDWFVKNNNSLLAMICEIGKEKNKLTALAETGYEAIPYADWWTETLLKAIGSNRISYVLLWRNHGLAQWNNKMHYYVPYKGQISQADFVRFYELDITLFEKDINNEKVYK